MSAPRTKLFLALLVSLALLTVATFEVLERVQAEPSVESVVAQQEGVRVVAEIGGSPNLGDSDGDGVADIDENACGSNSLDGTSIPERVDGVFAGADDDGDTLIDEALPSGSERFDCDGDGYTGNEEDRIFSSSVPSTQRDQDPCGNDGWPSNLFDGGVSLNNVNIQDVTYFVTPPQSYDMLAGVASTDPSYNERFNLFNGPGSTDEIDFQDITSLVTGSRHTPPMLGGATAFGIPGPTCPWPP